jgi:hypothetical protein
MISPLNNHGACEIYVRAHSRLAAHCLLSVLTHHFCIMRLLCCFRIVYSFTFSARLIVISLISLPPFVVCCKFRLLLWAFCNKQ